MYALGREEVWGCICTLRKSEYNQISGSMCGLFTKILMNLFRGTHAIKVAGLASLSIFEKQQHAYLLMSMSFLEMSLPSKKCWTA